MGFWLDVVNQNHVKPLLVFSFHLRSPQKQEFIRDILLKTSEKRGVWLGAERDSGNQFVWLDNRKHHNDTTVAMSCICWNFVGHRNRYQISASLVFALCSTNQISCIIKSAQLLSFERISNRLHYYNQRRQSFSEHSDH